MDAREIFDLIRNINDPEHPLSLEQLDVVKIDDVDVNDNGNRVKGWKISKKKFSKLLLPKMNAKLSTKLHCQIVVYGRMRDFGRDFEDNFSSITLTYSSAGLL